MNRLVTDATPVLMVSMIFAGCAPQASIQRTPSAPAIGTFLSVVAVDPDVLRLLDSTADGQPTGVPLVCLSPETEALFSSLEDMSRSPRKASKLAERLQGDFRAVALNFPSEVPSRDAMRSPLRIVQADTCTPGGGTPRLWVAISPSISNPYADPGYRHGFFANVRVECARGLIVERYSYWIAVDEKSTSGQPAVVQVVRVARGIDHIVNDRARLLP